MLFQIFDFDMTPVSISLPYHFTFLVSEKKFLSNPHLILLCNAVACHRTYGISLRPRQYRQYSYATLFIMYRILLLLVGEK